jgi:2-methylcitrate dehydratase PrpD
MTMNETRDLIRWVTDLTYSDIPANVVDYTKRFILDDVGCMLGGALQLGNKCVVKDVQALHATPESTIAVYGVQTTAPNAALANGAFIAGGDYDLMALGGGHMGSVTAALLAVAEREQLDGQAMLLAECAGIEVKCRIGNADGAPGNYAHPWHSNTALGPFSAAVAVGKLLDLDAEAMEHAVAIAASTLGGNYQHFFGWGSSMKRVRCGIGAWGGVRAALLAKDGLTGPSEVLEGPAGFFEAMSGRGDDGTPYFDAGVLTEGLGAAWYTLTYNTKAGSCLCVSSCGSTLEAALALQARHGFTPSDIVAIEVENNDLMTYSQHAQNRGTELGTTPLQRLGTSGWSLRWLLAETLVVGRPTIRTQLNNIRPYGRHLEIEALSERITCCINEDYYRDRFRDRPYPLEAGRVLIRLKDGRVLDGEPIPYPGQQLSDGTVNPITAAQLAAKTREQATVAGIPPGKQDRLIATIRRLEDLADARQLIPYLIR